MLCVCDIKQHEQNEATIHKSMVHVLYGNFDQTLE